jgi:hypothetical protein
LVAAVEEASAMGGEETTAMPPEQGPQLFGVRSGDV